MTYRELEQQKAEYDKGIESCREKIAALNAELRSTNTKLEKAIQAADETTVEQLMTTAGALRGKIKAMELILQNKERSFPFGFSAVRASYMSAKAAADLAIDKANRTFLKEKRKLADLYRELAKTRNDALKVRNLYFSLLPASEYPDKIHDRDNGLPLPAPLAKWDSGYWSDCLDEPTNDMLNNIERGRTVQDL